MFCYRHKLAKGWRGETDEGSCRDTRSASFKSGRRSRVPDVLDGRDTISARMPLAASLGFGTRLVNKCDHWFPNATVVELLAARFENPTLKGAAACDVGASRHFASA